METISLSDWLDNHLIKYSLRKDIVVIPSFGRCLIQQEYDHIFKVSAGGEVRFNSLENISFLKADEIDYIVFPFGRRWYYVNVSEDPAEMEFHILRFVGECTEKTAQTFYPLGIHTGYDLLNGSGSLSDWSKKAKFLGYKGLAVCDENTFASSLELQRTAQSEDIKFCFGYSLTIKVGNEQIGVKVYSSTQKGFQNLLRLQKAVAVDNYESKVIDMISLLQCAEGNCIVFDKWTGEWLSNNKNLIQDFIEAFDGWVFFQVDLSEYKADRFDSSLLMSQKLYFDNFYLGGLDYEFNLRPILLQDVYYLDKEDSNTKIILNKIASGASHKQSDAQYLKSFKELYSEFRATFSEKYGDEVFYDMCASTADIMENAVAAYDLSENYAPKYDMSSKEKEKYGTTLNMFHTLIEEGFKRLVPEGEEDLYRERLEYEKYVIESTDNIDYILIQRDEINWALEHGILTGVRGSACGSLLLYLMNITLIDPIKYNLMFERFLLPERGGLEAMETTKLVGTIDSKDWVEIEMEDGQIMKIDNDALLLVERDGERIEVYADELQLDDDIVWDRKDELHYLNLP